MKKPFTIFKIIFCPIIAVILFIFIYNNAFLALLFLLGLSSFYFCGGHLYSNIRKIKTYATIKAVNNFKTEYGYSKYEIIYEYKYKDRIYETTINVLEEYIKGGLPNVGEKHLISFDKYSPNIISRYSRLENPFYIVFIILGLYLILIGLGAMDFLKNINNPPNKSMHRSRPQ